MKNQATYGRRRARRSVTVVGLFAIIVLAAALLAGCAESLESAITPTTQPAVEGSTQSTAADSGEASLPERLVVGGRSVEEYLAEIPGLQEVLAANPLDLEALQALAVAQYNSGDLQAAADTYITMLGIEKSAVLHNNYANVLRDMKKYEEAMAQYRAAIEADPAHINAYVNAVALYAAEGRFTEAIALADEGIKNTTGTDRQRLQDMRAALSEQNRPAGSG